uniref:FHF complex subunit HOOK-interacting protein C-terminal domain-containing protein n=1 Tax=Astyanax mexicanus TaxID=7994 RepID=A0A8B9RHL1_ASTMX
MHYSSIPLFDNNNTLPLSLFCMSFVFQREPSINLLDSFIDHWKGITNYYIETTDESRPVKQTDIPWRLKQMLDILVYEEKQQEVEETGACMEYLLQHKILETLCTLGKAQYPPGMSQQVLVFFSKVLAQIQKPVLHLINVHRPIQKLIRLCGLPNSNTEKEEAQFMFFVCSRVKKDPYVLNYILEVQFFFFRCRFSCAFKLFHLILINFVCLCVFQKSRVALRAMESVMLLTSIAQEDTAKLLAEETPLCALLSQRLCELYCTIPTTLHPADLHSYPLKKWKSEAGVLVHTALLSCTVRHIHSSALLQELVHFLLGNDTHHEQQTDTPPHTHLLRYHLIEHCDHISDEISITTLRMFEELLKRPDRNILNSLVLRNLEGRSYRLPGSGEDRPGADELEEDPFFTDSEFSGSESLLSLSRDERRSSTRTQIAETVNSFLCLVPQEAKTTQHVQGAGYDTYVHDALKSLKECTAVSLEWGWPDNPKPIDAHSSSVHFYEGHFLKVLFDRASRILEQPYELNLQVTSVLSRLAVFPHPHLHEYLLDPYINLSPGARSLFSTLVRVIGELMQRIQHIPNFTQRLILVRRQLMGLEEETLVDHATLLKGVIVLEEFCKELAAIAFVKLPMGDQEHLAAFSP